METDNYTFWTGCIRPLKNMCMYLISNILYMFRLQKLPVTIGIYTGCFGNYNNSKLLIGIRKDLIKFIPDSINTYNDIHDKEHMVFSNWTKCYFRNYWHFIINGYEQIMFPINYIFIYDQYKFVQVIDFKYLKNDDFYDRQYYITFLELQFAKYSESIYEYFKSIFDIQSMTMFPKKEK